MSQSGYSLSAGRLSWENLRRRPFRTACLVIVVFILAFTLFGGSLLAASLQKGLQSMAKRFGADLMVVPAGYGEKAEGVLLRGEPSFFYFDGALAAQLAEMEGVLQASPQCFLTSLSTECCDAPVQLIAFDPATDFVIQPWIAEDRQNGRLGGRPEGGLGEGQLVVGSRIDIRSNGTVQLYNHEYPVAAQLSETATGFDTTIFMTRRTMDLLKEAAHREGFGFIADGEPEGSVSAVLVKAGGNVNPNSLAQAIKRNHQNVDVLVSQGILAAIAEALEGFVAYINSFSIILWIVAVVVLMAVVSGSLNERKKEFAILRILGAPRKKLVRLVLTESSLTGLAGSLAGLGAAALLIFPFNTYLSLKIGLPYIRPGAGGLLVLGLVSLALSFAAGPLAAISSAVRISRAETYWTLREGE
ncbi:MAG: FtsX-like permease family protein [Spirochaetales bacterium]|jgi:putative ABC transport system permease protein|nr:FtsX-like permease family protein [Spirochaetales bacterium]